MVLCERGRLTYEKEEKEEEEVQMFDRMGNKSARVVEGGGFDLIDCRLLAG